VLATTRGGTFWPDSRNGRPSRELLVRLGQAACGNALAYLDDVRALVAAGRDVRAFALTVMASEEMAKAFWCWRVLQDPSEEAQRTTTDRPTAAYKADVEGSTPSALTEKAQVRGQIRVRAIPRSGEPIPHLSRGRTTARTFRGTAASVGNRSVARRVAQARSV
jgi:hypothetical protein